MIVIATHNGWHHLPRLLESLRVYGPDDVLISIVVSPGSDETFFTFVEKEVQHHSEFLNIEWIMAPGDNFETGAWIAAYRHYRNAKYFMFLQDSMEVTEYGWYTRFSAKGEWAEERGYKEYVIPWVTFQPYLLGVTPIVRQRIIEIYGLYGNPEYGIFGSMFYCNRAALERVEQAGYMNYLPPDKAGSEACERFWALYFQRLGIPMFALHADGFPHLHRGGQHPGLTKHFHHTLGAARG